MRVYVDCVKAKREENSAAATISNGELVVMEATL